MSSPATAPRRGGAAVGGGAPRAGIQSHCEPVVFFDDGCGLCTGLVAYLRGADRHGRLRFAPLMGGTARDCLSAAEREEDTLWLVHKGRRHARSGAALRVLALLGGPWRLAAALLLVPRPLRDWVYDAVARRRRRAIH